MEQRRLIGIILVISGVLLFATLVLQTVTSGMPAAWTVAATGALLGAAMAWPLTRPPPVDGPTCRECGTVSWMSLECGFCVGCGSQRVWRRDVEPA